MQKQPSVYPKNVYIKYTQWKGQSSEYAWLPVFKAATVKVGEKDKKQKENEKHGEMVLWKKRIIYMKETK